MSDLTGLRHHRAAALHNSQICSCWRSEDCVCVFERARERGKRRWRTDTGLVLKLPTAFVQILYDFTSDHFHEKKLKSMFLFCLRAAFIVKTTAAKSSLSTSTRKISSTAIRYIACVNLKERLTWSKDSFCCCWCGGGSFLSHLQGKKLLLSRNTTSRAMTEHEEQLNMR